MDRGSKASSLDGRVYRALAEIPVGRVTTYAELARRVGCGSPRAVGQALARNPDAPRVPCHRVVRIDGGLGGYQGGTLEAGLGKKRRLLEGEGVVFRGGRVDLVRSGFHWPAPARP